jgi:hypothetical protein
MVSLLQKLEKDGTADDPIRCKTVVPGGELESLLAAALSQGFI